MGNQPEERVAMPNAAGVSEAATMQGASAEPVASTASDQAPATRFDLRVFQALRRIIRAVDLHSRKLSTQHDITGPQLVCLLSVAEHEQVTPSAIARHVYLSRSTVIGILDRLDAKGLVCRERDLTDRRLVQVSLTEKGNALVANAPSPLQDTLSEAMNELSKAELSAIAESLDRIVEMMEVRHIDAAPILETGPIDPTPGGVKVVDRPGGGEPTS
jgi:DNA-binding MarR family transcriptional regulator